MTRIQDTLKQINERLDLPQPARSRVLLEIAADLDGLESHFRENGLTEEEAQQKALQLCDLSDEAVSQLIQVHAGGYRRFLERFSAQAQTRWERCLLAVILILVAGLSGKWVFTTQFIVSANPVIWPILALTFATLMLLIPNIYAAYLKKDHNARRLRRGLTLYPVIACVNLLIGVYGFWLALYPLMRRAADEDEAVPDFIVKWLLGGSAMLIICMLSVIVITLFWFILMNKISRIEQAEAAVLLAE